MALLVRYNPYYDMFGMRRAFAQAYRPASLMRTIATQRLAAPMNVTEDEQGYQVRVQLPGMKAEDLNVTMEQNTLTVKGSYESRNEQSEKQNVLVREIASGSFQRSVTFSRTVDVEKATSSYENGILTITLPFSEASRARKISVKGQQSAEIAQDAQSTQDSTETEQPAAASAR